MARAVARTEAGYGPGPGGPVPECSVEATVAVIGGRWKPLILHRLQDGPRHYNALRRLLPGVTQRMLTLTLRELEADGVVARTAHPGAHPAASARVDYALTEVGRSLLPVLEVMGRWGAAYAGRAGAETARGS